MREMLTTGRKLDRIWLRDAALASLVFSLFLGVIGPLGDYLVVPVGTRIAAWTAIGMTGFAIYAAVLFALDRYRPDWPWVARLITTALGGTLLLSPAVSLLDRMITGDATDPFLGTYVTVLMIGLTYLVVYEGLRLVRNMRRPVSAPAVDPTIPKPSDRFRQRLPKTLQGDVICLEKEDHYLRVHTDQGDCLIRLRMSDAVAELADVPGQQTHRSWWVADAAVVSAERRAGGGAHATLSTGLVVPVSRSRLADIQQSGWFER